MLRTVNVQSGVANSDCWFLNGNPVPQRSKDESFQKLWFKLYSEEGPCLKYQSRGGRLEDGHLVTDSDRGRN